MADIEDLAVAEFLLLLSLTSKTGKLSAVHKGDKVLLALREGSIVYAASPAVRERLGSMLINRGLVTEGDLNTALDVQRNSQETQLLGSILVEMGAISREILCKVVQEQFEAVVSELLSWQGGVVVFEPIEIPDLGAVHVNPADVLVGSGVETDHLLLQSLARLQTEQSVSNSVPSKPVPERPEAEVATKEGARPEATVTDEPAEADAEAQQRAVRSLFEEMDSLTVSLSAEMTLAILGAAGEVSERSLLFLVFPGFFSGAGGFGQGRDGQQLSGRKVRIPSSVQSVLTEVVESGTTFRGSLDDSDGNQLLARELGGAPHGDVIAVPLILQDRVVAVLYADGGPDDQQVGPSAEIETTMTEIAVLLGTEKETDHETRSVEIRQPRLSSA